MKPAKSATRCRSPDIPVYAVWYLTRGIYRSRNTDSQAYTIVALQHTCWLFYNLMLSWLQEELKKKYFWEKYFEEKYFSKKVHKVHNVKINCILKTKVVNLRITVSAYCHDSVVIWIFASFLQVGGLASENVRWAEAVENFRKQEKTLCGDVLLITAFISYLGYFTKHYRVQLMDNIWRPYLSQLKVCELVCVHKTCFFIFRFQN